MCSDSRGTRVTIAPARWHSVGLARVSNVTLMVTASVSACPGLGVWAAVPLSSLDRSSLGAALLLRKPAQTVHLLCGRLLPHIQELCRLLPARVHC